MIANNQCKSYEQANLLFLKNINAEGKKWMSPQNRHEH